jgi:ubiquinone/menaquinone biosynthesis C-methylase UbiE
MKDDYYLDPRVAATYDYEDRGQQGDIEFYTALAREAAATGKPVLELGCGTGRVSIPIAEAGVSVVGLDRSPAMLEIARGKSAGLENVRWVEGDMANFEVEEPFGLVIIPCRSFLLLLTVAEQKRCLGAVRRHLVSGGKLALNFFNPDIAILAQRAWRSNETFQVRGPATDSPRPRTFRCKIDVRYQTAEQRIEERRSEEEMTNAGAIISRIYRNFRLRYVFRFEMEHLLELTGFEVEALYGGFSGEPFEDKSGEMVWVASRS